jgi:hypothetical protein
VAAEHDLQDQPEDQLGHRAAALRHVVFGDGGDDVFKEIEKRY